MLATNRRRNVGRMVLRVTTELEELERMLDNGQLHRKIESACKILKRIPAHLNFWPHSEFKPGNVHLIDSHKLIDRAREFRAAISGSSTGAVVNLGLGALAPTFFVGVAVNTVQLTVSIINYVRAIAEIERRHIEHMLGGLKGLWGDIIAGFSIKAFVTIVTFGVADMVDLVANADSLHHLIQHHHNINISPSTENLSPQAQHAHHIAECMRQEHPHSLAHPPLPVSDVINHHIGGHLAGHNYDHLTQEQINSYMASHSGATPDSFAPANSSSIAELKELHAAGISGIRLGGEVVALGLVSELVNPAANGLEAGLQKLYEKVTK